MLIVLLAVTVFVAVALPLAAWAVVKAADWLCGGPEEGHGRGDPTGGYPSRGEPVESFPAVPGGPAPGAPRHGGE